MKFVGLLVAAAMIGVLILSSATFLSFRFAVVTTAAIIVFGAIAGAVNYYREYH